MCTCYIFFFIFSLYFQALAINSISHELDVQVDVLEDDGKGHYSSVSMDKDCFKLRSNTKKKLLFNVSQVLTPSSNPLKFEK